MEPTPLLQREAVQQAQDIATERVEVPEWGGAVLVKVMTGEERKQWEHSIVKTVKKPNGKTVVVPREDVDSRIAVTIATCVSADGVLLFQPSDAAWLAGKSGAALDRIATVASRLNNLAQSDAAEEEQEKNS